MKKCCLLLLIFTACKPPAPLTNNCKAPEIKDCMCTMIYKPVCGCDGKTYSNACVAKCAGVKSWSDGACSTR